MKSIALVSLFGFAAFLTLMAVSSQLWLDPLTPLLVGLVGIALPMLVAVALMEPGFRKVQVDIIALSFASAILLGVALPGLWFKGEFRIHAVALATPKNIELVLNDPDIAIQEAGCAQAFELNLSADDIVRLIQSKPGVAAVCLARPDVGNIPLRLASQWRFDLNLGSSCDLTAPLIALESVSIEERSIELLDCALQAEDAEVRKCCTKSLSQLSSDKPLLDVVMRSSNELHQRGLLDELVLLSHEETETMKRYSRESVQSAGLTSPQFQAAALHAACRAALAESSPSALSSALRWTLERHVECVTNPVHLEFTPLVVDVCFDFVESEAAIDAFCALNRAHRAKRFEAQELAEQARAASNFGELADSIGRGHSQASNVTFEGYLDTVSQARDGRSIHQYSHAEQAALRRNLEAMRPPKMAKNPRELKGALKENEERAQEIKNTPELMRLMENPNSDEVKKLQEEFKKRARDQKK